eukprot:838254-Pelagomonas_calceolata.AAC.2
MYESKPDTACQTAWEGVDEAGKRTLLDMVFPLAPLTAQIKYIGLQFVAQNRKMNKQQTRSSAKKTTISMEK